MIVFRLVSFSEMHLLMGPISAKCFKQHFLCLSMDTWPDRVLGVDWESATQLTLLFLNLSSGTFYCLFQTLRPSSLTYLCFPWGFFCTLLHPSLWVFQSLLQKCMPGASYTLSVICCVLCQHETLKLCPKSSGLLH